MGHGQTISQPFVVAAMTAAARVGPTDRVLEIGTGSGYQAAVLAWLAGEVYTVERIAELATDARSLLAELGIENVHVRLGDGSLGWPEMAPFRAILVTAGAPAPPPSLLRQLEEDGGRLVVPVGQHDEQDLVCLRREGASWITERVMACRFVPLVGAEGWEEGAV
jgi:protein-L-isoaspartate(D-aspartate) O-methyltransferase